jgi:hypothetical protein
LRPRCFGLASLCGADDAPFVVRPALREDQEVVMEKLLLGIAVAALAVE